MNPLLELLSGVGYVLDTPGALLRGALSGKVGERATGREMLDSWGVTNSSDDGFGSDAAGFAADLIADPLNLVGGGLAKKAFQGAVGPMHAGDISKLAVGGFKGPGRGTAEAIAEQMGKLNPKAQRRALGEIPPGSTPLGAGSEAVTYRTPDGDVLRIQDGAAPRPPDIPEMRPVNRHVVYGEGQEGLTIQRMPYADVPNWRQMPKHELDDVANNLRESIHAGGFDPFDVYGSNIGKMGDEWKVIDPGAVGWQGRWPDPVKQLRARDAMSPILAALAGHNALTRSTQ